ncbi:universal stress protein [Dactylosporangium matsuzakiense]|uniref:Universal stress protein n=1 Tax=Dactylosporangium matsuzakiense TaxID=53360 RepID=A0A9W6NMI4_9ACTN|nr:universal stress protein [Dactylosporangium matsuzakiense]GLL02246.1 universal stress protein [Dactylosporangium matsuzakiense]
MKTNGIVVGYDGSPEARRAVEWAAAEAGRLGCTLRIVTTYEVTWPGAYYAAAAEQLDAARQAAAALVAEIAAEVRQLRPTIDLEGVTVAASAAATLLDHGDAGAQLLVVGNRGAGGLTNLLLGSVSQQVATHAKVPVAIVRGRPDPSIGPVVAGVDGSASGDTALGVAFEAARARGRVLVAVRAYPEEGGVETVERAALEESLATWRTKYPDVPVAPQVAAGRPAAVLVDASRTATLLVVGSRGHGGFAGLLLGSVGQQLMHHADCPVIIAH